MIGKSISNFKLLFNPGNAAQINWEPWFEGTGNTDFPLGVVKTDERWDDSMVGRYASW